MHNTRYKKASSRITRRSEMKRIFGLVLKIGLPVAFLVGLVLLLRADFLQIKNFEISGIETISAENLKDLARSRTSGNKFLLLPKSNILFLNKTDLANVLLSDFSRIEKVEINKKFFSEQIELKITERKDEFLWCQSDTECFSMTSEGLVFALSVEVEAEEEKNTSNKLIFKGGLTGDPLMQNFATPAKIQNYLKVVEAFKTSGFTMTSINIESNDKAVAKVSINGMTSDIIFNPEEPDLSLVAQNVLLLIKETKTKNPTSHFQYIDARFGNKMYYKLI